MIREDILKSFINNKKYIDERVKSGIEKYRKGKFTIKFSEDVQRKVTIKQLTHQFKFGCNAFLIDSFEEKWKEEKYKKLFANIFNLAVVPFYWSDLEPEEGKLRFKKDSPKIYRRPAPDSLLEFCREYNIEPKGHCLVWNHFVPEWLSKYNTDGRKALVEKRFKEISENYADKIPSFDIVNESATNYNRGRKVLFDNYDEIGLDLGQKYFPKNIKILNETNEAIWKDYVFRGKYMPFNMQLKEFILKKKAIDAIGLQYHIFLRENEFDKYFDIFLNSEYVIEILDLFNSYNIPMQISEITIPSYSKTSKENEAIQAELAEILYKIWFSIENMEAIVWWNLADGYAAFCPPNTVEGENYYGGGLLSYELEKKPSYKTIERLINKEWRTEITENNKGKSMDFCGFYGEYEITVESNNGKKTKRIKLDKSVKEIMI